MMVSVLTAPRLDNASYVETTLAHFTPALAASGATGIVFSDGRAVDVPAPWALDRHDGDAWGNRRMLGRVLSRFVESGCDRLLYLEDDVIGCRNLLPLCARLEIADDLPLVSLFDPRYQAYERVSLNRVQSQEYLYTQAFIVPRWSAEKLVTLIDFTRIHPVKGPNGCDTLLRKGLIATGRAEYGVLYPNPIRHIGEISSVWRGPTHVPDPIAYPGDDFDCLAWLNELNR
jgi:hypothetical protein